MTKILSSYIEKHGRQGFGLRQETPEQQCKDSFYGSDPRRGGDDTRQRLAERGQSKTLQERKRQIAVFSPKRIAEHDPGDDIPDSEL